MSRLILVIAIVATPQQLPSLRPSFMIFDTSATRAADVPPVDPTQATTADYLTSAADGVLFDVDGDGVAEHVAWTKAGSDVAFLAFDRDGDGAITNGKELVGAQTVDDSTSGPRALELLTGARIALLNSDVPFFAQLLLWTDRNHNAISEPSELQSASELLADVGLGYLRERQEDSNGNEYRFRGFVHVRTAPGKNDTRSPKEDQQRRRSIYEVVPATVR
jgi:hypothetical protein